MAETCSRQTPCTGGRARASVKTTCARKHPAGSSSSACSARWTPLGATSTNAPASCPLGHRPGRPNTHTGIHTTVLAFSLGRERTFTSMHLHLVFYDECHMHACKLTITITKCCSLCPLGHRPGRPYTHGQLRAQNLTCWEFSAPRPPHVPPPSPWPQLLPQSGQFAQCMLPPERLGR